MTKKVLCVIIVFSISMCFASCKKDDTFNEVLNVVLDVTDYELYIPDEENKGKWDPRHRFTYLMKKTNLLIEIEVSLLMASYMFVNMIRNYIQRESINNWERMKMILE